MAASAIAAATGVGGGGGGGRGGGGGGGRERARFMSRFTLTGGLWVVPSLSGISGIACLAQWNELLDPIRMSKLYSAVKNSEWETVEVRRPMEAGFNSECRPSRAVRLGLGRWTLEAVVAMPDAAMLCGIQPLSYTLRAGAPPCRP